MRFCLICLLFTSAASAQFLPGFVATEWTQMANNLQLLTIKMQQMESYLDQIKHTAKFKSLPDTAIERHMQEFASALRLGQSIVFTMQDSEKVFRQRYPGYKSLDRRWQDQYKTWSDTAFDTLQAVTRAATEQRKKMIDEVITIQEIRTSSMNAEGRMQVQQAQVAVGSETLNQLVKLRELMMANLSAQTVYQATQMQKEDAREAAAEQWFSYREQNIKGHKKW